LQAAVLLGDAVLGRALGRNLALQVLQSGLRRSAWRWFAGRCRKRRRVRLRWRSLIGARGFFRFLCRRIFVLFIEIDDQILVLISHGSALSRLFSDRARSAPAVYP